MLYEIGNTFTVIDSTFGFTGEATLCEIGVSRVYLFGGGQILGNTIMVRDIYEITQEEIDQITGGDILLAHGENYDPNFGVENDEYWGQQNWEESGWL